MAFKFSPTRGDAQEVLYLAARPYYPIRPASQLLSEALTREKAQRFVGKAGKRFTLRFDATPFPLHQSSSRHLSPLTITPAVLREVAWSSEPRHRVEGSDGDLDLWFEVENDDTVNYLCDRRDPDWDPHEALQQRIAHWGTQNWGGLTIAILLGAEQLYRCDVDVFSLDDSDLLSNSIRFFAISFDPERYGKESNDRAEIEEGSSPQGSAAEPDDNGEAAETAGSEFAPLLAGHSIKCLCGENIDVSLTAVASELSGGGESLMLVSCPRCRHRYQVRGMPSHDQLRTNVKYEVRHLGHHQGPLNETGIQDF